MTNYPRPLQPDVMTTDVFGYDLQAAAFTFNGAPIRSEGITDVTWKFEEHEFVWVTETRTIAQIVADLMAALPEVVVVEDEEAAALEQIMPGEEVAQ